MIGLQVSSPDGGKIGRVGDLTVRIDERAGAAALLDKPIDPPVLFSALTRLLMPGGQP